MINALKKKKKLPNKNFFDYSSKEQKKLIVKAAKESNEMQRELVRKYAKIYAEN
jgi:TRAP-type C4-dicarboxylate transport system substrate-binding protein